MTMAQTKTKAETGFAEGFAAVADRLPGDSALRETRAAALKRFAELGLPHRRIEEWKYTDLRNAVKEALPLPERSGAALTAEELDAALGHLAAIDAYRVVFVNGFYQPDLSNAAGVAGLNVETLGALLEEGGSDVPGLSAFADGAADAVVALNTAYMTDGAVVNVHAEAAIDKPLVIAHVRAGGPGFTAVRNAITIGAKASVDIVEAYLAAPGASGEAQTNAACHVVVGDDARVCHVKIAADRGTGATHLSNWRVELGERSDYTGFQQTQGVALARNGIMASFGGEEAKLDLSGTFLGRGKDHVDTTLVVDHAVPSCESRELFKGVLDDTSRGVFQGKIIVQQIAQKTDGKQMAQGLLLSPDAEFDSKPELEIFADDVACGHGATVAELDPDLMFYCQSRGIPTEVARVLLIESFIGEAIEKVENPEIAGALMASARDWLSAE